MSQKQKKIRGIICTLIGGTAWGFSGTCGQYIFANCQMNSGTLASIRMLGAGILLCIFNLIVRKKSMFELWKHPVDAFRLVLFALGGLMFTQYAYLTAIGYSNSGTATVLQNLGIILLMVITCIMERKLPLKTEMMAAILALAGVFLLATHGNPSELVMSRSALEWGLIAAVAMASYTLLPRGLLEKWGTLVVVGFAMLIGGIVLSCGFQIWKEPMDYSWNIIAALFVIVVIGTLAAFSLYLQGVSDIGPVKASMIGCVEPVVATILSTVWMGTTFAAIDLVGFVLIIGGVLLVSFKKETGRNQ
ncbi:MAG: DMT family transporter [Anaerobutyricum sp.]|nr:DMT family transporter [Anaerobutyricum sp.]